MLKIFVFVELTISFSSFIRGMGKQVGEIGLEER